MEKERVIVRLRLTAKPRRWWNLEDQKLAVELQEVLDAILPDLTDEVERALKTRSWILELKRRKEAREARQ